MHWRETILLCSVCICIFFNFPSEKTHENTLERQHLLLTLAHWHFQSYEMCKSAFSHCQVWKDIDEDTMTMHLFIIWPQVVRNLLKYYSWSFLFSAGLVSFALSMAFVCNSVQLTSVCQAMFLIWKYDYTVWWRPCSDGKFSNHWEVGLSDSKVFLNLFHFHKRSVYDQLFFYMIFSVSPSLSLDHSTSDLSRWEMKS